MGRPARRTTNRCASVSEARANKADLPGSIEAGDLYRVTAVRRVTHGSCRRFEVVLVSARAPEEELSADERAGLALVRDTGGIHQSDFWKELDISSRKGSRIVETLIEMDMIDREETIYNGHNTYFLTPKPRDLDFSLLMAGDMLSPFVGEEEANHQSDHFSQWIMNLAFEE